MADIQIRARYVRVVHASSRGVAERWKAQYCRDGKWHDTVERRGADIYNALLSLGETPDIDAVADIIGNKSWSYLWCNGCSDYVKDAVEIGEDEAKVFCSTCVAEAHAILSRDR